MQELLKNMTYGYYIVTSVKDDGRTADSISAATINWATQLSFDPVMIGISVEKGGPLSETINQSGSFTVHLLSQAHKEYIQKFAEKTEVEDSKINGVDFKDEDGKIVINGTLGYIKCELKESMDAGDHTFLAGQAQEVKMLQDEQAICTMDLPIQYTEEDAHA